jgi:putative DNA primase/helicase
MNMFDLDFSPITDQEQVDAPQIPEDVDLVPVIPVPANAPAMNFGKSKFGTTRQSWAYTDPHGQLVGYVLRFDRTDGRKAYCPMTYCKSGSVYGWQAKGFPVPYPLYNAHDLARRLAEPVLIVVGEKVADAAKLLFPQFVVVTNPYGHTLSRNADWSALAGRDVIISPNHSELTDEITQNLLAAVATANPQSIHLLAPKKFATVTWKEGRRVRRPAIPSGWDFHDALNEGWTAETIAAELGAFKELSSIEKPLVLSLPGSTKFFLGENGIEAEYMNKDGLHREWVCGHLVLVAQARDIEKQNWAKKFQLKTADGETADIILPASLLAGDAVTLREALLSAGLPVSSTKNGRERLTEYLSRCQTDKRILQTDRIGWHNEAFVTADRTCGAHPSGEQIEFAGTDKSKVGQTAGTLEGWQTQIASLATESSALVFAISCAFAAPLIYIVNGESGGFHFVGSSSIGKTTALLLAGSVWGGGGLEGYLKAWRATPNGLEGIAAAHCDVLLCLDEIGQIRGSEAGLCAYMLANGTGKIRANKFGAARPPFTWRVMILSSGEMTLDAKMREDRSNARAAAGQLVRFVNLPADAGNGLGIFGSLSGHESAEALARSLKSSCAENYGHAGLAFVDHLASDMESSGDVAKKLMADFIISLGLSKNTDGQVFRVANRFALVAAAGEMAAKTGIVPWPKDVSMRAAATMFNSWLEKRGGIEAREATHAEEQVRYYLNKNQIYLPNAQGDESLANSAGFVKTLPKDGKCFCFPPEVWQRDVCEGLDHELVARTLMAKGHLAVDIGRLDKQLRFGSQRKRFYAVRETLLVELDHEIVGSLSPLLGERLQKFL